MHSLQARGVNLLLRPKRGAAAAVDRCSIDGLAGVPKRNGDGRLGRATSRDVSSCLLVVLASVVFFNQSVSGQSGATRQQLRSELLSNASLYIP